MPSIKGFTAGDRQIAPPGTPSQISVPGSAIPGIADNLNRDIQRIAQIAAAENALLQGQKDDTDYHALRGSFNNALDGVTLELLEQPTLADSPDGFFNAYVKRSKEAFENIMLTTNTSDRAMKAFMAYAQPAYQASLNKARVTGKELFKTNQIGKLDAAEKDALREAASAPSIKGRNLAIAVYNERIQGMADRALISQGEAAKRMEDFTATAETMHLEVLAREDVDAAIEASEMGVYDKVAKPKRMSIIDTAVRSRDERLNKARAALGKSIEAWNDSVKREFIRRAYENEPLDDFADEYKNAFTPAEYEAYKKLERDRASGIGTGDPTVEKFFRNFTYNHTMDPKQVATELDRAMAAGHVGSETYVPLAKHLQARMDHEVSDARARRSELRTEQNAQRTQIKEQQAIRYNEAMKNVGDAFRVTGIADYDSASNEASLQLREEIQRRSIYLGNGQEDEWQLYQKLLPRYIVGVTTRMGSRTAELQRQIRYRDMPELDAARTQIGEGAYRSQVEMIRQLHAIEAELLRLDNIRNRIKGVPSE